MSVCLCDTTTERDIHINDTLVSQGLALFTPDTEEDKESYDGFQLESAPQGVRELRWLPTRICTTRGKRATMASN